MKPPNQHPIHPLKEARRELGLSQSQIAEQLGYASKDVVREIESGRRQMSKPAFLLLQRILEDDRKKSGA